jgi:lysozyme
MRVTKSSPKGLNIIKKFESLSLKPYLCPAGVPTVGWGSTYYEDGTRVRLIDAPISRERAEQLLIGTVSVFEKAVDSYTRDDINQNQFDALVSFAYNVGVGNLKKSFLLRKVNANPSDKTIAAQFLKWNTANGKVLAGLTKRRQEESNLYFS